MTRPMRPKLRRAEELKMEQIIRREVSRTGSADDAQLVRVIEQIEEAQARGESYIERDQPSARIIEELRAAGYRVYATRSGLLGERTMISWE